MPTERKPITVGFLFFIKVPLLGVWDDVGTFLKAVQ